MLTIPVAPAILHIQAQSSFGLHAENGFRGTNWRAVETPRKMFSPPPVKTPLWFVITQPICFLVFFISAIAETNRAPFDIPEAESELVAGYMTEYSGMQFALFFLAEYTNMFIVSAVAVTAFLGGWSGPGLPGPVWFFLKCYFLITVMIWTRFTFPRLRSDQLMLFCWKFLIPVAIVNVAVVGVLVKIWF